MIGRHGLESANEPENRRAPAAISLAWQAVAKLWEQLTEPAGTLTDPEVRQEARLLSSLILALMALVLLLAPLMIFSLSPDTSLLQDPVLYLAGSASLAYAAAYILSRSLRYRLGAVLASAALLAVTFVGMILIPSERNVYLATNFLLGAVLVATMLLELPGLLVSGVFALLALLLLPSLVPDLPLQIALPAAGLLTNLALVFIFQRCRSRIEALRLTRLQAEIDERNRAETILAQRNVELLALQEAGAAVASSLDVRQVLAAVTEQMVGLLRVDTCSISDWHPQRNVVRTVAESAPDHWLDVAANLEEYDLANYPLTKQVVEEQKSCQLMVSDSDADPAEVALMRELGMRSLLMVPMIFKGQVTGLVELADTQAERPFSRAQVALAQLMANQAASAIQNARMYHHAQLEIEERRRAQKALARRLEFEAALSAVSGRFAGALDIDRAIRGSLEETGRLVVASWTGLYQIPPGGHSADLTHEWCAPGAARRSQQRQSLSLEAISVWMDQIRDNQVVRVPDLAQLPPAVASEPVQPKSQKVRSALLLPVKVRGELAGFVRFDDAFRNREWSDDDLALLRLFAEILAGALERSQARQALLESEARYRSLVEDMPALVCRFLPDGTLTFVNEHYYRYFDRPQSELEGGNFFEFIPAEQRNGVRQTYSSLTPDRPTASYEHQVLAPNGAVRWQRWTDRALFNEDGRAVEFQSLGQDITEAKNAEEELRKHRDHLEVLVQQRSTELARAYQQLTELDALKGKFISDVSHELRMPIMNLGLYLDLLAKGSPSKRAEYEAVLRVQSDRLRELLTRILDFSGRDDSSREQSFVAVDLNQLVTLVADTQRARAQAHDLNLVVELQKSVPLALGDASQLIRVVENLVTNAISYTPQGEVRISALEGGEAALVCVSVQDTGMGLDDEDLRSCFERFYRGKRVEGVGIPGAGLGLAVVKEIVDLHRGRIEVQSQVDEGSTFTVLLPAYQPLAGEDSQGPEDRAR